MSQDGSNWVKLFSFIYYHHHHHHWCFCALLSLKSGMITVHNDAFILLGFLWVSLAHVGQNELRKK